MKVNLVFIYIENITVIIEFKRRPHTLAGLPAYKVQFKKLVLLSNN